MRRPRLALVGVVALALAAWACAPAPDRPAPAPTASEQPPGLEALRRRYGGYTPERAEREGWRRDPFCLDATTFGDPPDRGAMGFHPTDEARLRGPIEPDRPQAIMFDAGGTVLGVEYEVAADAAPEPPVLFGRRFGKLPAHPGVDHEHYALHVWFVENPSGVFADYNPRAACPPGSPAPPGHAPSHDGATAEEFDRQFIDMMVPHHEAAIEMARLAQGRAERPEVKQLVWELVRAHEGEILQLRQWRQQWYGSTATPPMERMPTLPGMPGAAGAPETRNVAAEVTRLRTAPAPFDRAFLDALIPHHQSAVDAALLALRRATRPEIKTLAQAILDGQQRELDRLRGWRQTWYAGAEPSAPPTRTPAQQPRDEPDPHAGH